MVGDLTNRCSSMMRSNETAPQLVELLVDAFILGVDLDDELLMLVLQVQNSGN